MIGELHVGPLSQGSVRLRRGLSSYPPAPAAPPSGPDTREGHIYRPAIITRERVVGGRDYIFSVSPWQDLRVAPLMMVSASLVRVKAFLFTGHRDGGLHGDSVGGSGPASIRELGEGEWRSDVVQTMLQRGGELLGVVTSVWDVVLS